MPDEGPVFRTVVQAVAEIGVGEKELSADGLREFFVRHSVTSRDEREMWTALFREFAAAQQTGIDLASWESLHPKDEGKPKR